jgi:hypothetical protein
VRELPCTCRSSCGGADHIVCAIGPRVDYSCVTLDLWALTIKSYQTTVPPQGRRPHLDTKHHYSGSRQQVHFKLKPVGGSDISNSRPHTHPKTMSCPQSTFLTLSPTESIKTKTASPNPKSTPSSASISPEQTPERAASVSEAIEPLEKSRNSSVSSEAIGTPKQGEFLRLGVVCDE